MYFFLFDAAVISASLILKKSQNQEKRKLSLFKIHTPAAANIVHKFRCSLRVWPQFFETRKLHNLEL